MELLSELSIQVLDRSNEIKEFPKIRAPIWAPKQQPQEMDTQFAETGIIRASSFMNRREGGHVRACSQQGWHAEADQRPASRAGHPGLTCVVC